MRKGLKLIYLMAVMFGVWACTGAKYTPLNAEPALQVADAYWQEIYPGQEDGIKEILLFLPCTNSPANYQVDSVYFKGFYDVLRPYKTPSNSGYRAKFYAVNERTGVQPPFTLTENEALVAYLDESGKRRYFKVENITQAESIYAP